MNDGNSGSPAGRPPPSETRAPSEELPTMAAGQSKRLRMQNEMDMRQTAEASHYLENSASYNWAASRSAGPSVRGSYIGDLLILSDHANSMLDAPPFQFQDCCASPKPFDCPGGTWFCLNCRVTSTQMNQAIVDAHANLSDQDPIVDPAFYANMDTAMELGSCCMAPYRKSGDAGQICCDNCGQVYFDNGDNTDASVKFGSDGATIGDLNSWGGQDAGPSGRFSQVLYHEQYAAATQSFSNYHPYASASSSIKATWGSDADTPSPAPMQRRTGLQAWRESTITPLMESASLAPASESTPEHIVSKWTRPTVTSNVPVRKRQPIPYKSPYCNVCMEEGTRDMNCELCHECHSEDHATSECDERKPKFHRFMELSLELRQRIYAVALDTDRPIRPHLCDYTKNQVIQFHDDNAKDHFSTSDLLGITRVSKEVRQESVPIFYAVNTFAVGPDTATYFDRLACLHRFHMIRKVKFSVDMRKENMSPSILRRMNQYIKHADAYEKRLIAPVGRHLQSLKRHPQYLYGGCPELNTIITLMKLTSSLIGKDKDTGKGKGKATDGNDDDNDDPVFHSKLVIPIPDVTGFTTYDQLKWFPTVMYGLGIQLHYVNNVSFSSEPNSTVEIIWRQRYQQKDFGDIPDYVNPVDSSGQTAAYKRALELDPDLESKQRPKAWAYLRWTCVGEPSEWFDIPTEGGGVGY